MIRQTGESDSSIDTGLSCVVMLARFHAIAADAGQLRHQFGKAGEQFGPSEILRSCKLLKLKARQMTTQASQLDKVHFPVIARHKEGRYFVIGGIKEEGGEQTVLIQDPLQQRPNIISLDELEQSWTGELVLITKRAGLFSSERVFNFKWFIPAIVKYKKLFIEVLVASFFIQILALVTPLFFQVVIDKVLVHKGLTTLDVLASHQLS